MARRQFFLSVPAGKELIAKGVTALESVRRALEGGTLAIVAGTTNAYVAREILKSIGDSEGFDARGFYRGIAKPAGVAGGVDFIGDVIIEKGKWNRGLTIFDVAGKLGPSDVILKGANAVNLATGEAGVLIGHPECGTMAAVAGAVVGRRARLIMPVGVEKRVDGSIIELADMCDCPEYEGPRLFPAPVRAYTELDALSQLAGGGKARLMASGGVCGYEGGSYFLFEGDESQIARLRPIVAACAQREQGRALPDIGD